MSAAVAPGVAVQALHHTLRCDVRQTLGFHTAQYARFRTVYPSRKINRQVAEGSEATDHVQLFHSEPHVIDIQCNQRCGQGRKQVVNSGSRNTSSKGLNVS